MNRTFVDSPAEAPRAPLAAVALFLLTLVSAVALVAIGLVDLVAQLGAAHTLKGTVIAAVLGLGPVMIGPVVLWAFLRLMPKALRRAVIRRLQGRIR